MTPADRARIVAIFRTLRESVSTTDALVAEVIAATYGISTAEVIRLAFFDGQEPPPRKPAGAAGVRLYVVKKLA